MDQAELHHRLRTHFGFRRFRPGQVEAVKAALAGRDALVLMPTGSGKSLCFQLPALELEGTTLVVSPLIALMKDQVDQLNSQGIAAQFINSSLSTAERRAAEESIAAGELDFVYTTPEQMSVPEFRQILKTQPLDLFVVDEAHCISQWGHTFRPEFLGLAEAIDDLGRPPVLALTATATDDIIDDILAYLRIPSAEIIHTGFYRKNLRLEVCHLPSDTKKITWLKDNLTNVEGSGIIYTATVKAAEQIAEKLGLNGKSGIYHGRMAAKRRAEIQDRFMAGDLKFIVATNAFGLGVDKPDIRFVVHYQIPGSMEAYYQEFGRAGRDGESATCTLLFDPADFKIQRFFQARSFPDDGELVNVYHALKRVAEDRQPSTLKDIQAISPVGKTKLRISLELFSHRRIISREAHGRIRLLQPDFTRDQIANSGRSYREKQERLAIKHQQMEEYASGRNCRWIKVLNQFGSDELTKPCGHCDICAGSRE